MKITTIHIEHFRCFESIDLALETCHALIGENGSGKTAILEAIDFATSPSFGSSRLDEQDFNSLDAGDILIRVTFDSLFWIKVPDGYATQVVPCAGVELKVKRRAKASPGRALSDPFVIEHYGIPVPFTDPSTLSTPLPAGLNVPRALRKTPEGFELDRKSEKPMRLTGLQLSLRNELVGFPNVFFFDKDRETQSKVGFNSLLQRIVRDLNWRFRDKWNGAAVAQKWETYYREVIDSVDDAKTGRIIRPLQQQAAELIGRDFSDLELSLLDVEQPFTKAFIARRTASNQIEQRRQGSGVSILIAYLLLDIISSLSKEEVIYLIDEPELHLHPQLQSSFYARLAGAPHQAIYSTQSDAFIRLDRWRSVTRLDVSYRRYPTPEDLLETVSGKTIGAHLDEIKQWYQHELIYGRTDNDLFFARRCLLVEGPIERYGVPVLSSKLALRLGDLTIISANGKSKLPYYQLLCRAFGIPYFSLFDCDGKGREDAENAVVEEFAASDALASFDTSLEALLGFDSASSRHKGSRVLARIDEVEASEIHKEIQDVLKTVSNWAAPTAPSRPRSRGRS